jgi:hypothetical protein
LTKYNDAAEHGASMSPFRRNLPRAGLAFLAFSCSVLAQTPPAGVFTLGTLEVVGQQLTPADALPARLEAGAIREFERHNLATALPLIPGVTLINGGDRNEAA